MNKVIKFVNHLKVILITYVLFFLPHIILSQTPNSTCGPEMVLNGDFETIDIEGCLNSPRPSEIWFDITSAQGWYGTSKINGIESGSPNFWHDDCIDGIIPVSCDFGKGYIGFIPGLEAMQGKLIEELEAGEEYCLSAVIEPDSFFSGIPNNLIFWFHNRNFSNRTGLFNLEDDNGITADIQNGPIGATPQIVNDPNNIFEYNTCNDFKASFCADGGEQYIVIDGAHPAVGPLSITFLNIDEISLKKSCPVDFDLALNTNDVIDCASNCTTINAITSNQTGGCEITNDFTYQWFLNGTVINGETSAQLLNVCINIDEIYSVEVTYSSGCKTITKTESLTLTDRIEALPVPDMVQFDTDNSGNEIFDLTTNDNTQTNGVTVTYHTNQNDANTGLNPIIPSNAYLVNNADTPLTIYLRVDTDIAGCFDTTSFNLEIIEVCLVNYPKYFTPNGDGFNDRWNILGKECTDIEIKKLLIYNRYGKLIIDLGPNSAGWDGNYNGKQLPVSDYWFSVEYTDKNKSNNKFVSHFTLKR